MIRIFSRSVALKTGVSTLKTALKRPVSRVCSGEETLRRHHATRVFAAALKRNGIFFVTHVRYFRVIFNRVAVRRRRRRRRGSARPPQSLSSNDDVPGHGRGPPAFRETGKIYAHENSLNRWFPLLNPPPPRTRIPYPFPAHRARTRFSSFGGRPSEKRIRAHVRKTGPSPPPSNMGQAARARCNFNIRIGRAASSRDVENGERPVFQDEQQNTTTTTTDGPGASFTRPVFLDGNGQRVVATIRFRASRRTVGGGGSRTVVGKWFLLEPGRLK